MKSKASIKIIAIGGNFIAIFAADDANITDRLQNDVIRMAKKLKKSYPDYSVIVKKEKGRWTAQTFTEYTKEKKGNRFDQSYTYWFNYEREEDGTIGVERSFNGDINRETIDDTTWDEFFNGETLIDNLNTVLARNGIALHTIYEEKTYYTNIDCGKMPLDELLDSADAMVETNPLLNAKYNTWCGKAARINPDKHSISDTTRKKIKALDDEINALRPGEEDATERYLALVCWSRRIKHVSYAVYLKEKNLR